VSGAWVENTSRAGSRRSRAGRHARPPATRRPPAAGRRRPPDTVRSPSLRWPVTGRRDRPAPARRRAGREALRSRCDRTRAPAHRTPPGPRGAQAGQRQRRVDARGNGDLAARRQAVEQRLDDPPAGGIDDVLGVVEHEQERGAVATAVARAGTTRSHTGGTATSSISPREGSRDVPAAQCGRQVNEQQNGVVVGRVEAQPGDGPALAGHPLQQSRRLARASGR